MPNRQRLLWGTAAAVLGASVLAACLLPDARIRTLTQNTLLLVAGTSAISLPVGMLLALLLVKTDLPGRRLAGTLIAILLFLPLYLQAGAWEAGFGLQGWYTLAAGGPPLVDGWRGAIWIHALAAVPWVTLIVAAGLSMVEPELEEEALLDAAPGQVFRRITLRRAVGATLVAALWVAVMTAGEISVTDLFRIRTFAEEVYTSYAIGETSMPGLGPRLATAAILIVAAGIACAMLTPPLGASVFHPVRTFPLRRWKIPATIFVWTTLSLLIAAPLGNLAYKAGVVVTQTPDGRVRQWSVAKAFDVVATSPAAHGREFYWSLVIAVCAATTALMVAIALAWLACRGRVRALPALAAIVIGLAVPGPVLGITLVEWLSASDNRVLVYLNDRTIFVPWLGQTIKALPLATLILWHALASVPRDVLQSAQSEGAGRIAQLLQIALPARWPAVALAWLVALIVAFGELAATIVLVPAGISTLPIRLFGLMHYGVEDQLAGICLGLVALLALLAIGVRILAGWLNWTGREAN